MWLRATLEVPEHPSSQNNPSIVLLRSPCGRNRAWGFLQSTQPFLCSLAKSPKYQFSGFPPTSASAEALHILLPVLGFFGAVNGLQSRVGWVI